MKSEIALPPCLRADNLQPTAAGIAEAAAIIHGGGIVAFPTETVYGLAADATSKPPSPDYAAKARPTFNPLIAHVASLDAALNRAYFQPRPSTLPRRSGQGR